MERLESEIRARRGTTVDQARTLPASWYADPDHFRTEVDAVFHHEWVGVGVTDDVAAPGSYLATSVGGTVPIVVTRDEVGELRAFHNVCRHRAAPVAEGCGDARLLQCPYHAWIYRLDGTLAKAGGIGTPDGFTTDDLSLHEVRVTTFARSVFVNLDADAPDFDPGPLAAGLTPYALDRMELVARDRWERSFNWKVFLENYSENYHTPFVHPELISAGWDYPMETAGPIVFAWDAPHLPRSPGEEALAHARPGRAGWERVADAFEDDSFIGGSYLTLWPNTMISVFADFAASLRLDPLGPDRTVVTREYFWHERVAEARRESDLRATQLVGAQDLDICEAVQRSHAGGTSADGPLSTEHERGVAHVHQLLVAALERSLAGRYAMSGRVRRADAEARKTEILETTIRVVLDRGFGNTRVSDVAAALGVSTGLIHYHFSSKGELLAEAFRFAADADIARVGKVLAGGSNALERLDRALRDYVPGGNGEEVWVLWIDAWGHTLRDPALREISEELDQAWVKLFERIIVDGVTESRFTCDDPGAVAWRLAALLDGLALHVTVHRRSMSRDDMLEHARTSACLELGLPRDALPRGARALGAA